MIRIATVPARVNIIGEHTDHFGGMALPFASQHRLSLTATRNHTGSIGDETVVRLWEAAGGWDANLQLVSDIPIGAGMSSSAALCVAIVMCSQNPANKMELAIEAQRIEREVLETNCGLLDQIAITQASANHVMLVDFEQMTSEKIPFPADWIFKLVDTGVRRKLKETNYTSSKVSTEDKSLHASEESDRVREALRCDASRLGEMLNESHAAISQKLCASTSEIDSIVTTIQHTPGVLGARLMGGGYGGMVLALLNDERALPGSTLVPCRAAFIQEFL